MNYTYYHSKYYAELLTLQNSSNSIDRLSQSIFNAQIDLNPHQIEAALFAFKSPLSNGVILADEVGLGKTIEAGLVLTQYWSEKKRRIIIIAPSSLRKQWAVELKEKFFLDSIILDGKTHKVYKASGNKNPFEQKSKIVITSYHFAARHSEEIFLADYHLAVIDEAHKLRNFHRGEKSKMSFAIANALRETKKVLLTATPLQNSLLEIFGLVSVVDDFVFGDKKSFRKQFSSTSIDSPDLDDLKDRLKPIVKRTLRKDVVEYIKYTKRIPIVEEFLPSSEEIALYDLISEFLLKNGLYSIPNSQKSLITLVVRKLLSSSTVAIMGTLESFKKRLKKIIEENKINLESMDLLGDEEELIEDFIEEEISDTEEEQERILLKEEVIDIEKEIEVIEAFIDIAKLKPVMFNNIEYIRLNSHKKKLKEFPEKERSLWRIFDKTPFEKQVALENITESEVLSYLEYSKYFDLLKLPLPENRKAIIESFVQDELIKKDINGNYSILNLGAILFAKDLGSFTNLKRKAIRVIQYKGETKIETIKEIDGTKGYAVGFEGLIDYINNLLPSNEVINKAFRETKKMYPELSIRELVANAIIHQDFSQRGNSVMIEIFTNRFEVTNPGEPLVDTERFLDSPPKSRNEILASFMRRINICEERGSGIDKVVYETELYQLPAPIFRSTNGYTISILFAHKDLKDMDRKDKIRATYMHSVLKYIQNDFMTNTTLRERFGIETKNKAVASRIIKETLDKNKIAIYDESVGSRARTYIPLWAK